MIFGTPPWPIFFDDPRKKFAGFLVQLAGLIMLIATFVTVFEMSPYVLIKLRIICPVCKERYWTFTYGKPRKCGC